MIPQATVQRPGEPAVPALEERARVTARVEDAVLLTRDDHPQPLQRALVHVVGVAAELGRGVDLVVARQDRALRLLPLARRVVRDPDPGAVEPRRDGREVAARARVAHGVLDALARERAGRDLEAARGVALEPKEPLLRADQQLGHLLSLP
jgi:hypothetical protein